ncbi:hypothetical protein Q5W_07955 [Hydrogenophaga sp. PBC]|nr:hypothetical protein Q5W_07955 [Hydrogenophaga sp. PBC]
MTMTTSTLTIEISRGSFYAARGTWGAHLHRDPTLSFWEFDMRRSDGTIYLWGFGRECVLSWRHARKEA